MLSGSVVNTRMSLPVLTTHVELNRDNLVCLGKNIAWAKPEPMSICGRTRYRTFSTFARTLSTVLHSVSFHKVQAFTTFAQNSAP